ncbi:MAG: YigZ family protein [Pseudomonadota bacterium]
MTAYNTPSHTQQFETEVKRSRFITTVASVASKDEAKAFVATMRSTFPDANHHCWAVICGGTDQAQHHDQSDDGEPKGTAGKPMLNVLQHAGLGNTIVVVTRYFGGIKLGAGGLVRAYTRAVSEALKTLETHTVRLTTPLTIELPYTVLDSFEHWVVPLHTEVVKKTYTESVRLQLSVPEAEQAAVVKRVRELGGTVAAA